MSCYTLSENTRILVIDDTESIHTDFDNILMPSDESEEDLLSLEEKLFGGGASEKKCRRQFDLAHAFQGLDGIRMVDEALAAQAPFALAFVDARMPPGIDGIETIARLWELDPEINIVLCSAYADYSWGAIFERLGDTDKLLILKKPFDLAEVQQMAYALCRKWNLQLQARSNAADLNQLVEEKTKAIENQKKHLQSNLQMLQDTKLQLFQADRLASVGQLAAGVAHEINNPIGYVRSNVSFLKKSIPALLHSDNLKNQAQDSAVIHEIPDVLNDIEEGLERVTRIVRDLLDFSRDKGDEDEIFNVNTTIEKTLSIAKTQIKCMPQQASIDVRSELRSAQVMKGNAGQIGQIVLNLVVNAAQAIKESGVVNVVSFEDKGRIVIRVTDNGDGIDEAVLHRIFDPFYTSKPVGEGTGLGLHIVQKIVNQHKGTIDVLSKKGKGTRFTLVFPVHEAVPNA